MGVALIVTSILVFGRIGGLLLAMPVFSAQGVPRHVPVLGAMAMTAVIGPIASAEVDLDSLAVLVMCLAGEVLLGLMMGSCVRAIFGALALASEIMSDDIVTERVKVNTGNLVFRLTPARRALVVRFLDVDVPSNFMDTSRVPRALLTTVWDKVVRTCLRLPTEPVTHVERYLLSEHWTPLF